MNETKQILEETREHLLEVEKNIQKLGNLEVELSLQVGTNSKTVDFKGVTTLEMTLGASVKQEM
jgi:hypothetical protein